jgi:hypothetical protein
MIPIISNRVAVRGEWRSPSERDLVVLLILLAPGFIAVRVKNSLLPYRPPSAFQETVEAALLSALLVPVWLLFAWRFLKARDHLIAASTTLAPLDLWLFVPVVGVIALVYLVISPGLGVLYALVQARQPYTAVARKLIRGRLDAHVHPEVWHRASNRDVQPWVRITAVQIAGDPGRRPRDFLGYWTSGGAGRDEVPRSCCLD